MNKTTVPVNRGTLAFDSAGAGEPMLLIHGLGSFRGAWDPITSDLAERFNVVRVDLPGHGDSPRLQPGDAATAFGFADTISRWLATNQLEDAHVVGSSLGGWIALELARMGKARSVTALAPAGFWRSGVVPLVAHANRWAARVADPAAPLLLRVDRLKSIGFWTSSAHPELLDRGLVLAATQAQSRSSGWAAAIAATHGRQCEAADNDSSIPVTAVWGDRDRILPVNSCQEPEGLPRHARWIRLRDCGHVPMWDQPEQSVNLIIQTAAAAHKLFSA